MTALCNLSVNTNAQVDKTIQVEAMLTRIGCTSLRLLPVVVAYPERYTQNATAKPYSTYCLCRQYIRCPRCWLGRVVRVADNGRGESDGQADNGHCA